MIRLASPSITNEELRAVSEALASGFLVQGARVQSFEGSVASLVGTQHAVAVSNCTAALHLSLLALDIKPADIVVVTAYSWPATANVIELCGARPFFVDIRPDTFNLDPDKLAAALERLMSNAETRRRVKAVLPVHTFGQLADMPAIVEIANRHGVPVIEDAACALAATLHGKQAGSWGIMGCFSFHPRKAITTGEGGMITTDRRDLADCLRALRNHGQDANAASPDFIMPGFNYRMTEFQAALGSVQLSRLEKLLETRRRLAARYDELFANTPVTTPAVIPGCNPVYQSYVLLLPEKETGSRDSLIKGLKEEGIETAIGTWNMPLTRYFRTRYDFKEGDFPVAERVFSRSLALPLHDRVTEEEQQKVARTLLARL